MADLCWLLSGCGGEVRAKLCRCRARRLSKVRWRGLAKVLCGLLCRLLWVLRWRSLAKMLCMSGKGSLCRVLGNQQVLELCTRGFKIEKNFVSNV